MNNWVRKLLKLICFCAARQNDRQQLIIDYENLTAHCDILVINHFVSLSHIIKYTKLAC